MSSDGISSGGNNDSSTVNNIDFVTSRDGTPIHVQAKGNYLAPHIIFAPGFATTLAYYDKLFDDPLMFTQLYMVRYDPRGHGLSGKPQTADFYTSDRYADDLKAIINAFHLKKPFFAGWSIGATIITDIAANFSHPVPFSGVIVLAGPVYFDPEEITEVATPLAIDILTRLQSTDAMTGLQARIDFANALSEDPKIPFTTLSAWIGGSVFMFPSTASLIAARSQDPTRLKEEGLAGWPILAILGGKDKIGVPSFFKNLVETLFKNHEVHTIQDSGHIVFYDAEQEVAHFILSFIKRVITTKPYP